MPNRFKKCNSPPKKSYKIITFNINKSFQSYLSNTFESTAIFSNYEKVNNKQSTAIKNGCDKSKDMRKHRKLKACRISPRSRLIFFENEIIQIESDFHY